MTTICRVDWDGLGRDLMMGFLSNTKLKIDGYMIELFLFMHKGKPLIALRVNGKLDYKFAREACEERRRFFRKITTCYYRPKNLKKEVSIFGEKCVAEMRSRHTFEYYEPVWPSLIALRRHLVRHNALIERV